MDRSSVRENYMRSSYVFNNTPNGGANRNFISTSLVADSDDLRKYGHYYSGLLLRICPITRRVTLVITFSSLLCFKLYKSRDYPTRLKYSE